MKKTRMAPVLARMILVFALLFPAAALAQTAGLVMQVHPAIWKIQKGKRPVYLFGSLHILPDTVDWTAPEIDAAMRASDIFVFEVPVNEGTATLQRQYVMQNGLIPRGGSLRRLLTRREYLIYSAILIRAGLKPVLFEHYRPWLASIILGLAYLHPDNIASLTGADDMLIDYARNNRKEMRYLETVDQQMALLNGANEITQVLSLKHLIQTLPRTRIQSQELFDSWTAGDADRLGGLIEGYFKGYESVQDKLIGNRNRVWMAKIKELVEAGDKTAMVTVGAAHISGEQGLLALLCAEGYDVRRISVSGGPDASVCGQGP
jgi:uncharacterized protein YbaP (TraB family)